MAGMCCDGKALRAFIRRIEQFAAQLSQPLKRPNLDSHRLAVARQQAMRQALNTHGLIAFIGDGARLARTANDLPTANCKPWRTPSHERLTLSLGKLGRVRGLGIRKGITAIAGAPYHGKSTLLGALAAGREDHIPHDGRELVVADPSAVVIQAEDGRRIKTTDLSTFFRHLPSGRSDLFSTERASGATSMAASLIQSIAAGCQLLLIDEDSAASNFLSIDPIMRGVLGSALDGFATLLETLPALATAGISTVLVAGSHHQSLIVSNHVVVMEHFQPQVATARVRRLLARTLTKKALRAPTKRFTLPLRKLNDHPDCLFGPRHFLRLDVTEAERPLLDDLPLD
jgi:predicted ABC-class ATPase